MSSPFVVFRTNIVVDDPDRNWSYFYTYDANLASSWTVGGSPVTPFSLAASDQTYDNPRHGGLQFTSGSGSKTVDPGRGLGTEATLTLSSKALLVNRNVDPSMDTSTIQSTLNLGGIITFAPGTYLIDQQLVVPTGTYLYGYGATLVRLVSNPYGGNYYTFYLADNVSIYGFSFRTAVGPANAITLYGFHALGANPAVAGLVFADNTLYDCNLGFYFNTALIRSNTFVRAGAVIAPGGLYLGNVYTGLAFQDPFQLWTGLGSVFMFRDVFDKTNRGPVFNGDQNDNLFVNVECHNIVRGNNGNECWLCEGGAANRISLLHCRIINCDSTFLQFDHGGDKTYVQDFVQRGGVGPYFDPQPGYLRTNVVMQNFELEGCGIYCGDGCRGASFDSYSVINWRPTRGNQTFQNPSPILLDRTIAVVATGPYAYTNIVSNARYIGDMGAKGSFPNVTTVTS